MKTKILVIDDDEEMCSELSEILKSEGYDVDSVNEGKQGKETAIKGGYSLILLDLKIPGITGFDILKAIRKSKVKAKVIVLSGRPMIKDLKKYVGNYNEEEENTLSLADAVINKPFDITAVLEKIKKLVE
ncbi:MAG: response regulator [Elusimicrobia bacterium]|nr:response regulator [Candidatus Liberimonas magnetica]